MRPSFAGLMCVQALCSSCASDDEAGRSVSARRTNAASPSTDCGDSQAPDDPVATRAHRIAIVAGGDVNLGRDVGQRLVADPMHDPLAGVTPLWADADLVFVNLESPLSDQNGETRHPEKPLVFTGPPAGARALARAGVDAVSLANNHAWDYRRRGFMETLGNLERAEVATIGCSAKPGHQYAPTVFRTRGWSIAVFAVTDVWNAGDMTTHEGCDHVAWADMDRLSPELERARDRHDVVLVTYHGGKEYSDYPAAEPTAFARAVMERGADAFIGHHPHVPQGVTWIDERPVIFSLGNLVFGTHRDHSWTGRGLLARLWFYDDDKGATLALCPYLIQDDEPKALSGEARSLWGERFRRHLNRISHFAGVGGSRIGELGEDGCLPFAPPVATPSKG